MGNTKSDHYNTMSNPENKEKKDWMSKLSDSLLLSEISIPGTHDTCALYGGGFAQCQVWSLSDQLLAGIRHIDIRCRHIGDCFTIHHGLIYQKKSFGGVLSDVEKFLSENPSECIIMHVQEEYKKEKVIKTYKEIWNEYYNKYKKIIHISDNIPKLGEVRGKVFITSYAPHLPGTYWAGDHVGYDKLDYQCNTLFGVGKKRKEILQFSEKGISSQKFRFISLANSYNGTMVYDYAKSVNDVGFEIKSKCGIISMDFPGEKLIDHIISLNHKNDNK